MRVLPVKTSDGWQLGVVTGDQVAVVPSPAGHEGPVLALLKGGRPAIEEVRVQVRHAGRAHAVPLAAVESGPLIPAPEKILCVGFNYRVHAEEMAADLPSQPNVFAKFGNCLVGAGDDIVLPAVSEQIDYEGELAVVIGGDCHEVGEADALSYVGGYTVFNDVSARDLQFQTSQWTLGKALDTFAPVGPVLALADAIADPQDLRLTTRLNGEVMQDASTAEMIFGVARIISSISQSMTLRAGDIIGTPEGVGWKRTPPRFLRDGDVIEVEISGIGTLRNPVRRLVEPSLAAAPTLTAAGS